MIIQHLDFYCERLTSDYWAEPLNAWSNLGFVISGIWAILRTWQLRRSHSQVRTLFVLSSLLCAVGIGSFLFHTFADNRTHLMDLLPIFLFTMVYIFHSFRNYLNFRMQSALAALVVIIGAMVAIELRIPKSVLNGSLLYAPPLIAAFVVSWKLRKTNDECGSLYGMAASVFTASLVARTLDMVVCDSFPFGTHFLWHLLNAVFLGILMKVAFKFKQA